MQLVTWNAMTFFHIVG